jgi:uncharacterized membrane protein
MPSRIASLLIGGIVPAFLFAGSAIFSKLAARSSLPNSASITAMGVAIAVVGIIASFFPQEGDRLSFEGLGNAYISGTSWGLGALCVYVAIRHFDAPISVITPLYNTNSILAVLAGCLFLSEWSVVNQGYLVIALFLFTVGGLIMTRV